MLQDSFLGGQHSVRDELCSPLYQGAGLRADALREKVRGRDHTLRL